MISYLIVFLVLNFGKIQRYQQHQNDRVENKSIHLRCDSIYCKKEFHLFFDKFKSDSVFQKQHIAFPYFFYYSDEDFPLDKMERLVEEDEQEFIDFSKPMNTYPHKESPFTMKIVIQKDSAFCMKQSMLNHTTIQYTFTKNTGCWNLVEIEDNTD